MIRTVAVISVSPAWWERIHADSDDPNAGNAARLDLLREAVGPERMASHPDAVARIRRDDSVPEFPGWVVEPMEVSDR